jgi:hypothetical protein
MAAGRPMIAPTARALAWAVSAALIGAVSASGTAGAAGEAAMFRRGVAVHNMLNWASVAPDRARYVWPPFEGAAHAVPDALIGNIRGAGFDFVRLTVDPGPFLQFAGHERDRLDRILAGAVRRFLDHDLAVIVDFHPNEQVAGYAPVKLVQGVDDPLFRRYVRMVGRTARVLAGLASRRLALEPMNEPPYGYDPATTQRWQIMLELLHAAVRHEAPDLAVVLTGAHGGDRAGLVALDPRPFAGSNVRYSFHYYEPHDFTHQGVETAQPNARHWRFFPGLPYPAKSVAPAEAWRRIEDNLLLADLSAAERRQATLETRRKFLAYMAEGFDRARIVRDFDAVAAWASRNDIPPRAILLGEFGVVRSYGRYRGADAASRAAWLGDVRGEAERHAFGWAIWELKGYGGMAIVESDEATRLDGATLRALGLGAP